ncbi:hypothetical protein OPV22_015838 [Ensete ventricosum]|uniref:Uncharacterized protein n=1 Tax=Ensete ventricosum TaxID=4639 RepID=A0AAV8RBB5_ENSVE|nr:hypothetical protein OPV22_015838 [Ensete ventricosum]
MFIAEESICFVVGFLRTCLNDVWLSDLYKQGSLPERWEPEIDEYTQPALAKMYAKAECCVSNKCDDKGLKGHERTALRLMISLLNYLPYRAVCYIKKTARGGFAKWLHSVFRLFLYSSAICSHLRRMPSMCVKEHSYQPSNTSRNWNGLEQQEK